MVWYHGSFVSLPKDVQFRHFTHFGTREAAIEVLTDKYYLDDERGTAYLYEVAISPALCLLDSEDFDSPDPLVWVSRLMNDTRFFGTPNDALPLKRQLGSSDVERRPERLRTFALWLKGYGYDGFRYSNAHEGVGSTSVAVADPADIALQATTIVALAELDDCFQNNRHRSKYARYRVAE
jgi:hypothetical protein